MTIKVTYEQERDAIQHCITRLITPTEFGCGWFDEDPAEAELWMAEVFMEAVEYFLEGLGIEYQVDFGEW